MKTAAVGTISRYRIETLLGESGMSRVYLARDVVKNQEAAVKVLKPGVTSSYIEDVIRFKREITAAMGLTHPNIVQVYDSGEYDKKSRIA